MRKRATALVRWLLILTGLGLVGVAAWQGVTRWVRPAVTVTEVVEGPVVEAFYATGTLLPEREYPIKSNNPGNLTEVFVDKGDKLKLNQPLAVVREDAVEFRYEQAKAERDLKAKMANDTTSPVLKDFDARLKMTGELVQIARREQDRLVEAVQRNAASQSDMDKAMDRVKTIGIEAEKIRWQRATRKMELEEDLQVAEAALKIAQWNLDRQTIRCPIDNATVLDRPLSIGTRVAVSDHIMQVADVRPQSLVMRAQVDEEDKVRVHVGQTVRMTLYAFEGKVFDGRVKKIYDKADPDRRTFEVDVEMAEKNDLYAAGMTGELAFIISEKSRAMVIPSQAVQGGKVWIVRDGQLQQADVQLGLRSVERIEVVSGLKAGDRVVVSPIENQTSGQRVRTTYMEPAAAAAVNTPKKEEVFRGFN